MDGLQQFLQAVARILGLGLLKLAHEEDDSSYEALSENTQQCAPACLPDVPHLHGVEPDFVNEFGHLSEEWDALFVLY